MNFAEVLLALLKRIANIDIAYASTGLNEDGMFELEVLAVMDGEVAPVCSITEDASEVKLLELELQLDRLERAVKDQEAEDAHNELRVREVLNKLTREERILIDRLLPEEMIPDSDSDEGVELE